MGEGVCRGSGTAPSGGVEDSGVADIVLRPQYFELGRLGVYWAVGPMGNIGVLWGELERI